MVEDIKLSEHFMLSEFTRSDTAAQYGIDNSAPPDVVDNLKRLAQKLEEIREILGKPIIITSGYRCQELNFKIGGASTSAHQFGLAADFIVDGISSYNVCMTLSSFNLDFDQLIYEQTWVHFGIRENSDSNRSQLMTYKNGVYSQGIIKS